MMYRIGIDLGGTNIAAGLVDESFHICAKKSLPTHADRDPALIVDDIALLCRQLCEENGVAPADVWSVGIASPGICDHDAGVVVYSCNLPFLNFPICAMLRERFPVARVYIENDANAAAWGEAIAGVAKGTRNSVLITLGTGVGGGIIIDGKVYSGFNYAGAELGHIVIRHGGVPCACGRRGCWEAYSSATALIRMTREKIEECKKEGRSTLLLDDVADRGKISGKTAFEAMRKGDAAATEVVDAYIEHLANGLTSIVNIFQPEVLSIGGGISNEGDSLIERIEPLVRKEQYGGGLVPLTQLRIASLKNDAGIVGAAVLGMKL